MQQHEYYMYSHSNRFTGTLTGQSQYGDRHSRPFEMNTSAQHKQFHEMKSEMPSDVLELFKANTISFLPAPVKPKCRPLDPVTTTCKDINSMFDVPNENLVQREKGETREEKLRRVADERRAANQARIRNEIAEWDPFSDEKVQSDPEKTLLVARLSYKTTQKSLRFEFEVSVSESAEIRIVRDAQGKSRGYGFVEFDTKDDFVTAYKNANYRKIDGSKIIVDYERGRTLLSWRPRRFGGGKGYLRMTREEAEALERAEKLRRKEKEKDQRERSRSPRRDERRRDRSRDRGDRKEKKDKKEKKEKKERRDRSDQ